MSVSKIVITGGPCAGKSSAILKVVQVFSDMGYMVIPLYEGASKLINMGITYESCGSKDAFEKKLLKYQMEEEAKAEHLSETSAADKVLIVCDRGTIDCRAYMTPAGFKEAVGAFQTNEVVLRDSYDAVFHMESVASGAKGLYSRSNNKARMETAKEAAVMDRKIMECWCGHPHLRIIGCRESFDDKLNDLIAEIAFFLGEPKPLEIERKYLIDYPDIEMLKRDPLCRGVEITQVYLNDEEGNFRIRKRGESGHYLYYLTRKKQISPIKRVETEERILQSEYDEYINNTEKPLRIISKTRYCFIYKNKYYELDVFPFWDDRALLEIELKDENENAEIPDKFRVIREVTEEKEYRNTSLADMLREGIVNLD